MTLDTSVGSCGLAPDELKRITSGSMPLNTFVRIASSGSFDYASLRSLAPLGIQRLDHLRLRDSQVFGNIEVISRAQVGDLQRSRSLPVIEERPSAGVALELQYVSVVLDRQNRRKAGIVVPARHARRRGRRSPGVVQSLKIVRRDAILIARQY